MTSTTPDPADHSSDRADRPHPDTTGTGTGTADATRPAPTTADSPAATADPDTPTPARGGVSRRAVLRAGALGAAAAAAGVAGSSLLPGPLLDRLAEAAPAGSLRDVRHVIFLMQENRAFDHYFGSLRGVQGFSDPAPLRRRDGGTVFEQRTADGSTVLPFLIRNAAGRQNMNAENVDALDHEWDSGQQALDGGWCDRWVPAKTASTMAFYDRRDLPFHYELADAFTICDQYFCSVPTSTSPNRNYWFSGWTGWEPHAPGTRAVDNRAYDDGHPGYDWPCLAEILDTAGVGWKVYQEWDNFTDNNLEYFHYTKAVSRKVFDRWGSVGENYYSALAKAVADGDGATRRRLEDQLADRLATLTDDERRLFDLALYRSPTGTLTDRVAADIRAGTLPEVSWIVAGTDESEHPSGSSPRASANLIHRLLDALGRSPETWRHTAVFITYDENDGYFDHVPPPRPPEGEPDEWYRGLPMGLGNRVPMIVVSPWTVGGHRCSEVHDHTSAARFLERWKGITVPTVSAWRRRVCGDLTGAFDFSTPEAYTPTTAPAPADPLTPRWTPDPPEEPVMPYQEPGTRPQRPLPYRVSATAEPIPDGRHLRLTLRNAGPRHANLLVHPFHDPHATVGAHDVLGEVTVDVPLRDGRWDVTITGPAGFRADFRGDLGGGRPGGSRGPAGSGSADQPSPVSSR
ncbi:alkaline phosphatase family protein [Corynebacterium bovis]|uniref:alkaline phosphatase family protein n=5 Tax=Corynebacterium bovis TaxID=36808 RepID=UPI000F64A629|nr:alkaline phosphatase family protein [Corynebacterium bovis]RRQ13807.1 phospholipase C, phosphocholine-specific [Corynebacterium bovis]